MRGFISIMCGTLPSVIKPPQKWKMIDGNSKAEIQKAKYNQHDVHTCDWCTNSAYQWHFIHGDYVQMLHNDIWVIIIICTHIRKFLLFIKQNTSINEDRIWYRRSRRIQHLEELFHNERKSTKMSKISCAYSI